MLSNLRLINMSKRVFHLVDRYVCDQATADREAWSWRNWDSAYEKSDLLPIHIWPEQYKRSALDIGDKRRLPYLLDCFQIALDQTEPGDIIAWTNQDTALHRIFPEYCRFAASVYGPISFFRTELDAPQSLDVMPKHFARFARRPHVGRDAFAFSHDWLKEHLDEIPPFILGAEAWDLCMAAIIRLHYGIKTTADNLGKQLFPAEPPNGYVGHLAHKSSWSDDGPKSPANQHNVELFRQWLEKTGMGRQNANGTVNFL